MFGVLRLFLNHNLHPTGCCFSKMKYLKYQKCLLRNIYASANVALEFKNDSNSARDFTLNYFRNYILKNNNFKNSVSEIINLDFTLDDKHKSLKLLCQLKENPENESLWQETLDYLNQELNEFDQEDFLKAIALTSNINKAIYKSEFIKKFIKSLDKELKLRKFQLNDSLEILYVLKHSLCSRLSLKNFHFYLKFFRKYLILHRFQPLEVAHIFYYLEKFNPTTQKAYKYPILKHVKENISKFNMDEMGIILAALVRGKLYIYDVEFIEQFTNKILNEIEAVDSLHLFYASKFLLGCSSVKHFQVIMNFQEQLMPYISKFNVTSTIMLLFSGYPYCLNASLWDKAVDKIKSDPNSLNLLNLERMARITTLFKVKDEEFLKLAIQEVEEMENIGPYLKQYLLFCKHLIIHRIYSKKLIDKIVSKNFIDTIISGKSSKAKVEWIFINNSLQIDKPEYQCHSLDKISEKKILSGLYNFFLYEKPVLTSSVLRSLLRKCLKEVYGENKVIETYCLSHFEKGVIMTFDKNLKALPIPEDYKITSKRIFKKPLNDNIWICMNVCFILPKGLNAMLETYKRHLIASGYLPILVPHKDFYQCRFIGKEMKKEFFENLIQTAVQENLKEKQEQKLILCPD